MSSLQKKKMILESKNKAIEEAKTAAKSYCREYGLSVSKLMEQVCLYFGDSVYFAKKTDYKGTGLMEDLASQPLPTLVYIIKDGSIKETEYTKKYLS